MVIPSGGLYGLDNSEIFKAKLAEYVSRGGTLIVFSQQHGYEFGALPGAGAELKVSFSAPDKGVLFEDLRNFDISAGAQKVLSFDVPTGAMQFGEYVLDYQLLYADKGISVIRPISNTNIIKLSFAQAFYRAGEDLALPVEVVNTGGFNQSLTVGIGIEDFGYSEVRELALAPGETGSFEVLASVPVDAVIGRHSCRVDLNGIFGKDFDFFVPESKLEITLPVQIDYNPGDNLNIELLNSGGGGTDYSVAVKVIDFYGEEVLGVDFAGSISAGEMIPLSFALPSQMKNGEYRLLVSAEDLKLNRITSSQAALKIIGLAAGLEAVTDKENYLLSEAIDSTTTITNLNAAVQNASLKLAVYATVPAGTLYGTVLDSAGFAPIAGARVSAGGIEVFSNQEGKYKLAGVSVGEQIVNVSKSGYDRYEVSVTMEQDVKTMDIYIVPSEYGTLSGGVSVIETGETVVGGIVTLTPVNVQSSDGKERRVYSDSAGNYEVKNLPAGEYNLNIESNVSLPFNLSVIINQGANIRDIALNAKYTYGTFSGKITVSGTGAEVIGAKIMLTPIELSIRERTIYTDKTGNYNLDAVAAGNYDLTIEANGCEMYSETINIAAGENIKNAIVNPISEYAAVSGIITDISTSNPIEGASVSIGGQSVISAVDGTYGIENIQTGIRFDKDYSVRVEKAGYVSYEQQIRLVEGIQTIDVVLEEGDGGGI